MLIVTEDPATLKQVPYLSSQHLINAHYASFDDIRWHRLRLINHDLIVLIPQETDISYHLKYILMNADSAVIVVTDQASVMPSKYKKKVLCFPPDMSADFFNGVIETLVIQQKNHKTDSLNFVKSMTLGKFILTHIQESAIISRHIAETVPNAPQLRRGIFELLMNAFEHGVYQLGFDYKQALIRDKKYFSELSRRIRLPDFDQKHVELVLTKKEDGLYINIKDPGLGFDYKPYLEFDKNASDQPIGKGISFAAKYCFDKLVFKNDGTSVYAVLNQQPQPGQRLQ